MPAERELSHYVIGYFDVLGQSGSLVQPGSFPPSEKQFQEQGQQARRAIHAVDHLRRLFRGQFETFAKGETLKRLQSERPSPQRADLAAALASKIVNWGMSDAYVAAVPLARGPGLGAVADVYRLLLAAAVVWLTSLAMGNPIRGGVEVGTAAPLGDNEVYGEGLVRAYRLESRAAQWPRIVVGQRLLETLRDVRDRRIEPTASFARDCCLLLRQDLDDRAVVDVLGRAMARLVGRSDLHEAFPKAHDHVRGQIRLHRDAGDCKLVSRYETLLAYFDEQAPLWRPAVEPAEGAGVGAAGVVADRRR